MVVRWEAGRYKDEAEIGTKWRLVVGPAGLHRGRFFWEVHYLDNLVSSDVVNSLAAAKRQGVHQQIRLAQLWREKPHLFSKYEDDGDQHDQGTEAGPAEADGGHEDVARWDEEEFLRQCLLVGGADAGTAG